MPWIVLFVLFDLVVTALVLTVVLRRRAASGALPAGILDLGRIRAFTGALHPRVGEYVRANWSGDPAALPGVLAALLEVASRLADEHRLTLEREALKRLLEQSIASHQLASRKDVREAMKQVA